jgi:hydrogenase/urease accessory protein HupE
MKRLAPRRAAVFTIIGLVMAMSPGPAEAHLTSTGMGPIYDGMVHFITSPEDLVPVFALALLAGLRGPTFGRRALFVLPSAWLVGGTLGVTMPATNEGSVVSAIWFLLLGGLLAANAKLSLGVATTIAALLGLHHGYLNGAGMGESETAAVVLIGLASTVFVFVALPAAFVVRLRAEWARIAVRVAGSWIAASGILMFGWAMHGA